MGARGELVDGVLGLGWLPLVETSHEDEHIHSGSLVLECLVLDMDLLIQFPVLPEVQPLQKLPPWMAKAESGV